MSLRYGSFSSAGGPFLDYLHVQKGLVHALFSVWPHCLRALSPRCEKSWIACIYGAASWHDDLSQIHPNLQLSTVAHRELLQIRWFHLSKGSRQSYVMKTVVHARSHHLNISSKCSYKKVTLPFWDALSYVDSVQWQE